MKQRAPRRNWHSSGTAAHRPRVLVENGHPALAISDFSMFERAGLDIAWCSGPRHDRGACPVQHGRPCPLAAEADAVLHGLDPALGIAAALRRQRPGMPVLVEQRRRVDGSLPPVPEGCTPLPTPCSVKGQIDALWRVLTGHQALEGGQGRGTAVP